MTKTHGFWLHPALPPARDPAACLPARLSIVRWVFAGLAVIVAYGFLFIVVHPYIDTRRCVARIPDPLFSIIPFNDNWFMVTHPLFFYVSGLALGALLLQAWRGEHRPVVRFAVAVSVQALFRSLTMALLPICKVTAAVGKAPLDHVPTLDLGFARIPWLTWATNDLIFSGHVCEFLVLYLAVRAFWPRIALWALILFQLLQAVALIATRGHYTVDIVIAVPFAFLADRVAIWVLSLGAASYPTQWPEAEATKTAAES